MTTLTGTRTMEVSPTLLILALSLFVGGCLSGGFDYTSPQLIEPSPQNSRVVDQPVDNAWKILVPALGSRFFVINNLDKASGLINVSYAGDPERYIDCGQVVSWVENLRGKRTYSFSGASPTQSYEAKGPDGLYFVERRMNLEGRVNVILESLSATQTRITVNTRYVVTRQVQTSRIDLALPNSGTDTISFNSGQGAEFPRRGTVRALACQSTGRLEAEILDLLVGR